MGFQHTRLKCVLVSYKTPSLLERNLLKIAVYLCAGEKKADLEKTLDMGQSNVIKSWAMPVIKVGSG